MTTLTIAKKTFSLKAKNYKMLQASPIKNKSKVVNEALELYFKRENYRVGADEMFFDDWIQEARDNIKKGNVKVLNPDGGRFTREDFFTLVNEPR